MKALLINPADFDNLVTDLEIDEDGYTGISEAIGLEPHGCFTGVPTDEFGPNNVGYIDDEGLINGAMQRVGAFAVRDYTSPLAGKAVVLGIDHETGESTDVDISAQELAKKIGVWTSMGPIFQA